MGFLQLQVWREVEVLSRPYLRISGMRVCGGDTRWSLAELHEESHCGLGSGPDATENRRGRLTPFVKIVMP